MGILGFRGGVLRAILGRRRGAYGAFCREIPGFLGGARVRRGDSAHGGHCRGGWGEKNFKNFLERGGKPKNWDAEGAGRQSGRTLYRVREVIFRHDL